MAGRNKHKVRSKRSYFDRGKMWFFGVCARKANADMIQRMMRWAKETE